MKGKIATLEGIFRKMVENFHTMGGYVRNIPLAKEAFSLMKELPDIVPEEFDTPAAKAEILCSMLDQMVETESPRFCISVREYIRDLDPNNEENSDELRKLRDYIDLSLPMEEYCKRYRCHLKFDPVERTERWEEVIVDVEEECNRILRDVPKGMGYCFAHWHEKEDVLRRYGIEWKSPSRMNPGVMFD